MHPYRSSHPGVFLGTGVLKIYSNITGEYLCQSAISIKLLCNFIEIILRHGCSPVKMMHIFRTPFLRNTSWWLLLSLVLVVRFSCYLTCICTLYQRYFIYNIIDFILYSLSLISLHTSDKVIFFI